MTVLQALPFVCLAGGFFSAAALIVHAWRTRTGPMEWVVPAFLMSPVAFGAGAAIPAAWFGIAWWTYAVFTGDY